MKTDFSFTALKIEMRLTCKAPVGVAVRKSAPKWVCFRLDKETMKKTGFKDGVVITPFIDEANRAMLFLTDQRPLPPEARTIYGKDSSACFELPRAGVLAEWFEVGPIRPVTLCEATHGRLVIQVPKKPAP